MGNMMTAILLGAVLLLLGVVTAEVSLGTVSKRDPQSQELPPRDLGPALQSVAVEIAALESLTDTIERPLFLQSRRPPAPEAAPTVEEPVREKPVASLPRFVVSAIVIADGERTALLRNPSDGRMLRVVEGDDVQGWTLEEVQSDRVVLATGGRRQELPLRMFLAPPATPRQAVRRDGKRVDEALEEEEPDAREEPDALTPSAAQERQRRRERRRGNRNFQREPES